MRVLRLCASDDGSYSVGMGEDFRLPESQTIVLTDKRIGQWQEGLRSWRNSPCCITAQQYQQKSSNGYRYVSRSDALILHNILELLKEVPAEVREEGTENVVLEVRWKTELTQNLLEL